MTKKRQDVTARLTGVAARGIAERLAAKGKSRFGAKRKGTYEREEVHGTDFSRAGAMVRVDRVIDRGNDRYTEKVVDLDSGTVLRDVEEPLSRHTDRGSARKR